MNTPRIALPLNPMRAFAVASRHQTFTAAAKELGVTQVAVSRQISILEDFLGVKLFDRDSRSARLTDVGRSYGQEIGELLDEMEAATQRVLKNESENTIQLRVYPSVAHYWLLPRLPDFYARHPELRVRLDTKVTPLDFRGTHLDVAFQLGTGLWREARSRKLFDERIDVVAAPSYLADHGPFNTVADVTSAEILHSRYRRRAWDLWAAAKDVELDLQRGVEYDSSLLTYSAASQGFGLAMGQIDLLQDELKAGRLVTPFDNPVQSGLAFHIVWPTTISVSTNTRLFIDWLLDQAGKSPEFFKHKRAAPLK